MQEHQLHMQQADGNESTGDLHDTAEVSSSLLTAVTQCTQADAPGLSDTMLTDATVCSGLSSSLGSAVTAVIAVAERVSAAVNRMQASGTAQYAPSSSHSLLSDSTAREAIPVATTVPATDVMATSVPATGVMATSTYADVIARATDAMATATSTAATAPNNGYTLAAAALLATIARILQ
jgi:hypothetical protein